MFIIKQNDTYNLSVSGQLTIRDSPDEIQVSIQQGMGISMEKLYSVFAILRTDGGESVSTEMTSFSK